MRHVTGTRHRVRLAGVVAVLVAAVLSMALDPSLAAPRIPQVASHAAPALKTARAAAAPTPAADATFDPWQEARRLADAAQYDSALAVLRAALAGGKDDFELRWLEAGVTGEAGRHRDAVALYERLAADHPERAGALRGDLGGQRLEADDPAGAARDYRAWLAEHPGDHEAALQLALSLARADSLRPALAAYDSLLRADPGDAAAALGRARVLAWLGRNGDAIAAYRGVLARDPGNADARLGLAMNENWTGRHRAAARRLEALARASDADPEATKALAFARYWDDEPDGARRALDDYLRRVPDDAEAQELSRRLARERRTSLRLEFGSADDSDGLRVSSPGLELTWPLSPSTTALVAWRDDHLRDDGGERDLRRLTAGFREHVSPAWSAYGQLTHSRSGDPTETSFGGEFGVISRPVDRLRLEAVVAREPVLTRRSVELDISLLSWIGAVDLAPTDRLTLHADGRAGFFSDQNRSERVATSAGWKAFARPRGEISLRLAGEQLNTHFDPDHGYYAPGFHREWGPGADAEWRPREDRSLGVTGQYGWQHDKGGDTRPFVTLVGRAELRIGEAWTLALQGGHSNSRLWNAAGYERGFWQAATTLGF